MAFLQTTAASISSGGTINGDLTISGDLTVNPGSNTYSYDEAVYGNVMYLDSNVAHGMTGLGLTNAYGSIEQLHSLNGGIMIRGMSDAAAGIGVQIYGTIGVTDPTDAVPAVEIRGSKKSGTSHQALAAAETVFQVGNLGTDLVTVLGSGNVGIGTDAPGASLHIERDLNDATADDLGDWDNHHLVIVGGSSTNDTASILLTTTADTYGGSAIVSRDVANYQSELSFWTKQSDSAAPPTRVMTLDSSGSVGIGTDDPDYLVSLKGGYLGWEYTNGNSYIFMGTDNSSDVHEFKFVNNIGDNDHERMFNWATNKGGTSNTDVMTLTRGGKLGIGVVPEAWDTFDVLQLGGYASISGQSGTTAGNEAWFASNAYYASGWKYIITDEASAVEPKNGDILFKTAVSGSADASISWIQNMKIDANSRISLSNNDVNTYNTVLGYDALTYNGTPLGDVGADYNVAIGHDSMGAGNTTTATFNTAVGYLSLRNVIAGSNNTTIGANAGASITSGSTNIAVGARALTAITTGSENTVVGFQSAQAFGVGETGNISIGANAMNSMDEGTNGNVNYNVAIGLESFLGGNINTSSTDVIGNIAIGAYALDATSTNAHTGTIAIGHQALTALTSGDGNTAIGYQSQDANTTSGKNTSVGYASLGSVSTSASNTGNTAVGYNAGLGITTGLYNTVMGWESGDTHNVTGAVYMGQAAGSEGTGNYCTFIGMESGASGNNTQAGTVGVGYQSLKALTSGSGNVAVGYEALTTEDAGGGNVALGYRALKSLNNDDGHNIAIGHSAMVNAVNNYYNVAIGSSAGSEMGSANVGSCVLIGRQSGDAINHADASGTVAIGASALTALTSGAGNVAMGYQAGKSITTNTNCTFIGYQAGMDADASNTSPVSCTYIGSRSGENIDDGTGGNTAVGYAALFGATSNANTAANNVAVGVDALFDVTSGGNNVGVGKSALESITTGEKNIMIGATAGDAIDGETNNVGIGYGAMGGAVNGADKCIAIGSDSLSGAITQDGTIAIGHDTLAALTDGSGNTAVGYQAGKLTTTGTSNVYIGYQAGDATHVDASANVAIGKNAFGGTHTGTVCHYNTAVGDNALAGAMNGVDGATALGFNALEALTTGAGNTAVGWKAATDITAGASNTAVGHGAMDGAMGTNSEDSSANTAIGKDAMGGSWANQQLDDCVAVGQNAMSGALDNCDGTVAVGKSALAALTSGAGNVAVGYQALDAEDAGVYSTAVGYQALSAQNNDTGRNTAVGWSAGDLVVAGYQNTLIGAESGTTGSNDLVGGYQNTLIGQATSVSAAGAINQTVIGRGTAGQADNSVTLGNASVAAVYMGQNGATGDGATVYAKACDVSTNSGGGAPRIYMKNHVADAEAATFQFMKSRNTTVGSHTIVQDDDQLGNLTWYASDGDSWERAAIIQCLIDGTPGDGDLPTEMLFGVSANGAASPTTRLTIAPDGTLSGSSSNDISDERLKENIKTIPDALDTVKKLTGRTFTWKEDDGLPTMSKGTKYGLIAQELEAVLPDLVTDHTGIFQKEDGTYYKSITSSGIIPVLIEAVKELTAKVEALEAK